MPIRVNVQGHGVVEFPDGTDEATMSKALAGLTHNPQSIGDVWDEIKQGGISGALGNLASSAKNTAAGMGQAVGSAVNYMFDPAARVAAAPGVMDAVTRPLATGARLVQGITQRYGSPAKALDTAYHDPVGVAVDASAALDPIAGGARMAGLSKLADVAEALKPTTMAGKAVDASRVPETMQSAGGALKDAGIDLNQRALKITRPFADNLNAGRWGRSPIEKARNVSEALLQDPDGGLTEGAAMRFGGKTQAMEDAVDSIVGADPNRMGDFKPVTDSLQRGLPEYANQFGEQKDVAKYGDAAHDIVNSSRLRRQPKGHVEVYDGPSHDVSVGDSSATPLLGGDVDPSKSNIVPFRALPAKVAPTPDPFRIVVDGLGSDIARQQPVGMVRQLTQGTYKRLNNAFNGELQSPEIAAKRAAAAGGREMVNTAFPDAAPINSEIAKRIDMGDATDNALFRSGKTDPLKLGEMIALSGGHNWLTRLPFLANRPGVASWLARRAYGAGGTLGRAGVGLAGDAIPAEVERAALLAAMAGRDDDQSK